MDVKISPSTNCLSLLCLWTQECMEGYTLDTYINDMWGHLGQRFMQSTAQLWKSTVRKGKGITAVPEYYLNAPWANFVFRPPQNGVCSPWQVFLLIAKNHSGCVATVNVLSLLKILVKIWSSLVWNPPPPPPTSLTVQFNNRYRIILKEPRKMQWLIRWEAETDKQRNTP